VVASFSSLLLFFSASYKQPEPSSAASIHEIQVKEVALYAL
jgi:hypothetical protein